MPCLGLNGGPAFKHIEAFSFQVATADQAGTDHYWDAIVGNGGRCKDRRAVVADHARRPDGGDHRPRSPTAKRAFDAMMTMRKIDIAAIDAARRG
jgi:2-polyprenyl-6-hydroxyphenyl methylase/3-demethylubiquinone-9 3-methyltransferase